jgi:hypothetical protein
VCNRMDITSVLVSVNNCSLAHRIAEMWGFISFTYLLDVVYCAVLCFFDLRPIITVFSILVLFR